MTQTMQMDDAAPDVSALSRSDKRTLAALFRHPLAHNLPWSDVLALFGKVGAVEQKANDDFAFQAGGEAYVMRKPHGKELTGQEVIDLRHFATRAGLARHHEAAVPVAGAVNNLVVVMDHHEAKIYQIDAAGDDEGEKAIKPYDPHHFLHHLTHKDESRERGQRSPEDATFYERIAQALVGGGKILLVGHGTGKSNAAHHLADYLAAHHKETHARVVTEMVTDLSAVTQPQLLALAAKALH